VSNIFRIGSAFSPQDSGGGFDVSGGVEVLRLSVYPALRASCSKKARWSARFRDRSANCLPSPRQLP
jgi:hypothetical protein